MSGTNHPFVHPLDDPWCEWLLADLRALGCAFRSHPIEHSHLALAEEALGPALTQTTTRVVAGFSRGARLVAALGPNLRADAFLAFGFPFHRHGAPQLRHGLSALREVSIPTLVVQGTRDPHGSRADVRGYCLPPHVEFCWVEGGNHRLKPRSLSALESQTAREQMLGVVVDFVRRHSPAPKR